MSSQPFQPTKSNWQILVEDEELQQWGLLGLLLLAVAIGWAKPWFLYPVLAIGWLLVSLWAYGVFKSNRGWMANLSPQWFQPARPFPDLLICLLLYAAATAAAYGVGCLLAVFYQRSSLVTVGVVCFAGGGLAIKAVEWWREGF